MSTNFVIIFGALFLLVLVTLVMLIRMEIRLKKIFRGANAQSLEDVMKHLSLHADEVDEKIADHFSKIETLKTRVEKQGRGIKLLRFNPFSDVGGNQSFAVGVVNSEGDGVVFSSLYSRERMSVFAKPVSGGKSDIELSPEEQSVIKGAQEEASK